MNIEELQKALFAAARAVPPNDHVPYAFEKRIMAALLTNSGPDVWALWSRLLWRAAAPCIGVMLLLAAWTFVSGDNHHTSSNLAADLDRTVWGPLLSLNDSW